MQKRGERRRNKKEKRNGKRREGGHHSEKQYTWSHTECMRASCSSTIIRCNTVQQRVTDDQQRGDNCGDLLQ